MTVASHRAGNHAAVDSILIIKPGSFGDIIHALPALLHCALYPKLALTWLVDERWQPLLDRKYRTSTKPVVFPAAEISRYWRQRSARSPGPLISSAFVLMSSLIFRDFFAAH